MKTYKVTVNGNVYEITIEAVDKADIKTTAQAPAAQAPAAQAPAAQAPVAQAPVSAPAGGQTISAPMPGTILKVNVSNGQAVKKGDILFILEAMKMENEIMAPCDGTVNGISVAQGATVEAGTALCTLA